MSIEAEQSAQNYAQERAIASQFALPVLLAYSQVESGNYDLYDFIWNHNGAANDLTGIYAAADPYTQAFTDRRYSGCDHAGNLVVARHMPEGDIHDPDTYRVASLSLHDNQVREWTVDEADVVPSFTNFRTTLYLKSDVAAAVALSMAPVTSGDAVRDILDQRELEHMQQQSRQVQPRVMWSQQPAQINGRESNGWVSIDGIHLAPTMGLRELLSSIDALWFSLGKVATHSAQDELISA